MEKSDKLTAVRLVAQIEARLRCSTPTEVREVRGDLSTECAEVSVASGSGARESDTSV